MFHFKLLYVWFVYFRDCHDEEHSTVSIVLGFVLIILIQCRHKNSQIIIKTHNNMFIRMESDRISNFISNYYRPWHHKEIIAFSFIKINSKNKFHQFFATYLWFTWLHTPHRYSISAVWRYQVTQYSVTHGHSVNMVSVCTIFFYYMIEFVESFMESSCSNKYEHFNIHTFVDS